MRRVISGWSAAARSVGEALLDVWRAEAEALREDFSASGRELRRALLLIGGAAAVGFWTVGLGLWVAIELLTLQLTRWQAALVVFALALLVTVVVAWLAVRVLRSIESPVAAVRRRGQEHVDWWQQSVLPGLGAGLSPEPDDQEPEDDDRTVAD